MFAQFVKPNADQLATPEDIKELWAANLGKGRVLLLLEYADHLFPKPGSQNAGAGAREATLLKEWARNEPSQTGVWVVMSAQSDQALHPRVLTMLGSSKAEIMPPDAPGRGLILRAPCMENQLGARRRGGSWSAPGVPAFVSCARSFARRR